MNGILDGMRVIEGSAFVAAPLGGMTLAQMGADVIRFDPIGGGLDYHRWPVNEEDVSLFWHGLNKGKRSIQVDLRNPRGRELLSALITQPGENGGLFLTNFPARGWLGFDALAAVRADLVMVNIVGNHDGSSAVDYTVNPATGFPWATGPRHLNAPFNHLLPAWDCVTGQMAVAGLLAAERHRRLRGQGQLVRIALSDVAFAMVGNLGKIAEAQVLERDRIKDQNYLYGAFGRDFTTKDGRRIMVVALTLKQWTSLVQATELQDAFAALEQMLGVDLRKEGDRWRAREAIGVVLKEWTITRTVPEIAEIFDRHGVCWGPYYTFREAVNEDPRCSTANPMFEQLEQPGIGTYLTPGSPLVFSELARVAPKRAPLLGEHTDQILGEELGLSGAEVGKLHDEGVVAGPKVPLAA
ncbi:MAG: CoA transferase [Solirubrobacteraceae bacterium]